MDDERDSVLLDLNIFAGMSGARHRVCLFGVVC
eukprot:COSAG02_NODE_36942_length_448_cov_1.177650_2_plen_32_part_01